MGSESPEDPSFREFLGICDPALLMLLGEYVSRLINGEEAPRLRSMRLLISLESIERFWADKEPGEAFSQALRELWPMISELVSRYAELRDSAESGPGERVL